MPPRPTGTDGSDHSYRMVIAERYQRMADFKHTITRLMASHVVLSLAKAAWTGVGSLEGHPIPVYMLAILAGEAGVIATFAASKMGNVRESLATLKVYNLVQATVAATQVLCAWRYYNGLNLEKNLYSKIATRKFLERGSGYSEGAVFQGFEFFELFLDMTFAALLIMCILVSHKMIKEKMALKKEAAEKGAAKRAGSDDGSDGPPEAVLLEGAASPDRRLTAKASTRARRRMA